ncbi:outer membrane protein assembly factor BamE [Stakelama tenebrarum]|uniref:Outer membrane protein assembly factor BamE n=1 Tax=Stakelama tenebrarum TaxID=2711215 RepID=A0A6G6Y1K4_9SPHN|nr:outer membrane protein assembly factor BamE [Sphingosinithalassobacter tenebrarum]QIG78805.1 outer membrane protein assembly factor BamE [Sphingosinithalassobacter tenebrarum]
MSVSFPRFPVVLLAVAALASACSPVRGRQGYVVDPDLVNAIQPGVDNRDSVMQTLGHPTLSGEFTNDTWYYISRKTRNLAFNNPQPESQSTIIVRFEPDGTVQSINRTDESQIASIEPYGKTTPTLGRNDGFFEDLFGNIGTVGAPGTTGGTSGP